MIFKMYECDFGFKIGGVNYEFEHVESFTVEDPENTKLIRGANAANKIGLAYKEGLKEAKKVTVTVIGMSAAIKALLDDAYTTKARIDVYGINRNDGSSKIAKNAVVAQQPQQLAVSDSADSMNVALVFESFDLTETHKS